MSNFNQERIKFWLRNILVEKKNEDFSVNIVGNSEKGDGYLSDVIFVEVTNSSLTINLKLVLKQSKNNAVLRETTLINNIFLNEIHMYEIVIPTLKHFQVEKGILEPFDNVPKFYGRYIEENIHVIALENLKAKGYELWDKKKPLSRKNLEVVVNEYAKFHASAAALKFQKPDLFATLANGLKKPFIAFGIEELNFMFGSKIEKACQLLKNEIDDKVLQKWKNFRNELRTIFKNSYADNGQLKVFTHGDCWINNFLFKHSDSDSRSPKVFLLDLQMSTTASPILDLSHFLFSAISSNDMDDLDSILNKYYDELALYLEKLGSRANVIYPYQQFLSDWKTYCKHGLAIAPVCYYAYSTKASEVPDGNLNQNFGTLFTYNIQDYSIFKERVTILMKYAVKNNLI